VCAGHYEQIVTVRRRDYWQEEDRCCTVLLALRCGVLCVRSGVGVLGWVVSLGCGSCLFIVLGGEIRAFHFFRFFADFPRGDMTGDAVDGTCQRTAPMLRRRGDRTNQRRSRSPNIV